VPSDQAGEPINHGKGTIMKKTAHRKPAIAADNKETFTPTARETLLLREFLEHCPQQRRRRQ
jgi:hypothetical protein